MSCSSKLFREHFDPVWGQPSIRIETHLRLMFLKYRYRLGYETLCAEVADSVSWFRFARMAQSGLTFHRSSVNSRGLLKIYIAVCSQSPDRPVVETEGTSMSATIVSPPQRVSEPAKRPKSLMSKLIAALAATAVCLSAFSISMAEPAGASAYQGSSSRACHVGNNAYFGEKADKVRLKERSGLPWCVMGRDGSQFITKGPVVKAMQTLLYCHVDDFHQRDIDGDFGPKTEWAVKKFQWATGLDPDGIVGGGTLDQLFKMKIKRVGNELELAGGTDCGWGNVKVRVRLIERNPNQDGWQLGWVRGLQ